MGVEAFDLEWTWAIFLGAAISASVIYLIITKRYADRTGVWSTTIWSSSRCWLGDFEGSGWRGFHHHTTISIVVYGFLISETKRASLPSASRRPMSTPTDHEARQVNDSAASC